MCHCRSITTSKVNNKGTNTWEKCRCCHFKHRFYIHCKYRNVMIKSRSKIKHHWLDKCFWHTGEGVIVRTQTNNLLSRWLCNLFFCGLTIRTAGVAFRVKTSHWWGEHTITSRPHYSTVNRHGVRLFLWCPVIWLLSCEQANYRKANRMIWAALQLQDVIQNLNVSLRYGMTFAGYLTIIFIFQKQALVIALWVHCAFIPLTMFCSHYCMFL